jgi:hypothetical protein
MAGDPLYERIVTAMDARGLSMELELEIQKRLWMDWIGICALETGRTWLHALAAEVDAKAGDSASAATVAAKLGRFADTIDDAPAEDDSAEQGIDFLRRAQAALPSEAFDDLVFAGILIYKLGDAAAIHGGERAAFIGDHPSKGLAEVVEAVGKGAARDFPDEHPSDAFIASLDAAKFVAHLLRAAGLRAKAAGVLD